MTRPNVLFITADQWRGDCLPALGHPCLRTPHLDALARDGVLFRRHYAQCAPCGPSRASLLTGTYLHTHRSCINGTPLDARFTNIALEARKLGYRPALFGYTDTSLDPRTLPPGDPRLNTYEGLLPGFDPAMLLVQPLQPWLDWLQAKGFPLPKDPQDIFLPVEDYPGAAERGSSFAPPRFSAAESDTAFLTESVLKWLDEQAGEPWFAHVTYLRPHPPFIAPEPYNAMYRPQDVPAPRRRPTAREEAAQHPWLAWALGRVMHRASGSERAIRQLRATYYGLMSQVDDAIGTLLRWLQDHGQYERTVIVFTSDHGEMLGDHWLMGKLGYFDESFHVPLVVRAPDTAARGVEVEQFTESVDVMPTLLDLLGAEAPRQCEGRALTPFLQGGAPTGWRTAAHWEYDFRDPETHDAETHFGLPQDHCAMTVIRDQRCKYVHFTAMPPLYFDLARDPGQFVDRSRDPDCLPRVLDCAQRLLSWRMSSEERVLSGFKLTPSGLIEARETSR